VEYYNLGYKKKKTERRKEEVGKKASNFDRKLARHGRRRIKEKAFLEETDRRGGDRG